MSIIHINQIADKIKNLFSQHLDLNDIRDNDLEKETKILTRCLAAYAVFNLLECSPEVAAKSVVDGGDDNGIDAIYYSPPSKRMVIVQSKWNKDGKGEPDSSEVAKFCKGVKDLFEMNFDRFNLKIAQRQTQIEKAISEYETKYTLVLIDTSEKIVLAEHAQRLIRDLLEEMNSTGEEEIEQLVEFDRLNQGKIYSSFALSMGDSPIDIEIGLSEWGKVDEPYKAYYGMVSAKEIAKWWRDYERKLFNKNIRQVLGSTDVNDEIEQTLIHHSENFWYYNNGITIIAKKIDKSMVGGGSRTLGAFKLEKISIINGAQTVSTIGKYSKKQGVNLDNVKVHVRLINLKDTPDDFGKEVTKANNRQNRIENRDFVSQDPEQIRIKTELALEEVDYNIVRSELFQATDKTFDLQEATVALACASKKPHLAVQAKRGIGKFYENIDKGIYKELFNGSVEGIYVYNCVRIDREINNYLKDEIQKLSRKSGRHYGMLVHGNRIISLLSFNKITLNAKLNDINYKINTRQLRKIAKQVKGDLFTYLEKEYPENILGTLFKNASKCENIITNLA